MKPLLKLSKDEMKYWPILTNKRTTEWNDIDNAMAAQMCRDLRTLEELARNHVADDLMPGICRRLNRASQLLNLNHATTSASTQSKIVEAILKAA